MPDICLEKCKWRRPLWLSEHFTYNFCCRFFKGEGWDRNLALAADYYKMAAVENYEPAVKRLAELNAIEEEEARKSTEKAARRRSNWKIWSIFGLRKKAIV